MLRNSLLVITLLAFSILNAQEITAPTEGINFFHGTWAEALKEAEKTERPIFVDAFTTWCGPCKAMAKNVFTQKVVGDFFNANFLNMKLDMETPDGKSFESKYPVSAYPTLFFIDTKGKVLKKVVGGQQAEGLIAQAKDALKKNDTSIDLAKEYEGGKRDYDFVLKYVKSLNNVGKPSLKIANDFLATDKVMTPEQKMNFIFEAATEADSKLFETILQEKDKYITLVGKDKYNEKVKSACRATLNKSIEFETPALMTEAIDKANQGLTEGGDNFKYASQMTYYQNFKNKNEYIKAAENLAKKSSGDDKTLKFIAEDICKNYKDDEKVVNKATDYAESAYKTNKNIENLTFYCKMLIDGKKVEKAIKIAEEALASAKKKEDKDLRQFEGLLNFVKSKKA